MKILLAGNGKYIQFAPSWVEALKTLDHDVEFFDFSLYSSKGLLGKLEHHMIYKRGFDSMNSRLLAAARDYMPDITVIHNGNAVYRETIIRLKDICWDSGAISMMTLFGAFGSSPLFNNFKKDHFFI